jgi:hypothetical protein
MVPKTACDSEHFSESPLWHENQPMEARTEILMLLSDEFLKLVCVFIEAS